jgi:hypothetical protein
VGRLAAAYTFEADLDVRRALVVALAARTLEADAPARREALALASRLDPDGIVHVVAARAEASRPASAPASGREIAWLRVVPATGASLPAAMVATVVCADGLARSIAFDEEGYALVPGLPPGEARVRLAPGLPAYESH